MLQSGPIGRQRTAIAKVVFIVNWRGDAGKLTEARWLSTMMQMEKSGYGPHRNSKMADLKPAQWNDQTSSEQHKAPAYQAGAFISVTFLIRRGGDGCQRDRLGHGLPRRPLPEVY